jgi:uncharacterized membrane-anchored protein YhcB (DUF1043 family)
MKKIILSAIISTYAMSGFSSEANMNNFTTVKDDKRLCKVFIKKAHDYQTTMEDSEYAKATLDTYKERVVEHCSTVASSSRMREILVEGDNKVLCKTSIREAHEYKETMNNSQSDKATLDAHVAKVRAYCGALAAKS